MNDRQADFKLSVVVPCFNEGEHLALFVQKLVDTISVITPHYEIIVINDGSTDQGKMQ